MLVRVHTRDTPPRMACTARFTLSDIVFRLAFGLTSERKVMKVCQSEASSFENVPRKPLSSTRSRENFSTINDRSLPRNFATSPSLFHWKREWERWENGSRIIEREGGRKEYGIERMDFVKIDERIATNVTFCFFLTVD